MMFHDSPSIATDSRFFSTNQQLTVINRRLDAVKQSALEVCESEVWIC